MDLGASPSTTIPPTTRLPGGNQCPGRKRERGWEAVWEKKYIPERRRSWIECPMEGGGMIGRRGWWWWWWRGEG